MEEIEIEMPSTGEIDRQILKLSLEEDLYLYMLWVFKEIYKRPFEENWHHKTICRILMDVHKGDLLHVIITIPPRYSKSEIVVKIFISWCYAKNASCEFINLAYSDDLALANSSAIKEIILHEKFQTIWPVEFKKDSTAKKKWKTTANGEMSAAASGGSITGFGAGKIGAREFSGAVVIDDPLKPEDSNSDTIRNGINNRFPQTIKSRLNDRKTPMIIIMQRLHEDDPVGFLLNGGTELEFTHINIPAINEDGPSKYDPREKGEALWPFKHNIKELELMRISSALVFAGQYQQRPAPMEGNIFKWFKYYTELPDDIYFRCHSWDFTFKKSKTSDYVVGSNWGKTKSGDIYLIDLVRAKMSFTESLEAIKLFTKKHSDYKAILIEAKANGEAIIDSVKGVVKKVVAINPTSSKEERVSAVAPMFQAGDIYLPSPTICPWIEDFVNELKVFPNGKHDDQVDSATQAIEYLDSIGAGSMGDFNNSDVEPYRKTFHKKKKRSSRVKVKDF